MHDQSNPADGGLVQKCDTCGRRAADGIDADGWPVCDRCAARHKGYGEGEEYAASRALKAAVAAALETLSEERLRRVVESELTGAWYTVLDEASREPMDTPRSIDKLFATWDPDYVEPDDVVLRRQAQQDAAGRISHWLRELPADCPDREYYVRARGVLAEFSPWDEGEES